MKRFFKIVSITLIIIELANIIYIFKNNESSAFYNENKINEDINQWLISTKDNRSIRLLSNEEKINEIKSIYLIEKPTTNYQKLVKKGVDKAKEIGKGYVETENSGINGKTDSWDASTSKAYAQNVKEQMEYLCFLYQITENEDEKNIYYQTAIKQILEVCELDNWYPESLLTTAEMSFAVALGYDWLYEDLSEIQKEKIVKAIIEKGINEAEKQLGTEQFSAKDITNWGSVCYGGMLTAAMSIIDFDMNKEDLEKCLSMIETSIEYLPKSISNLAPDGCYIEGTDYWIYAMEYASFAVSTLRNCLKTDFGLSDIEGLKNTILYPIYITGKNEKSYQKNKTFNYADSDGISMKSSAILYFSKLFAEKDEKNKNLAYLANWYKQKTSYYFSPTDLIWYDNSYYIVSYIKKKNGTNITSVDEVSEQDLSSLGLKQSALMKCDNEKMQITTMRNSYTDNDGIFVGIKNSSAINNHNDLDAGSFVFDALGTRWIEDLGKDNYNLDGYFYSKYQKYNIKSRWNYYKKRAEGHNTLVINEGNDADQKLNSTSSFIEFNDSEKQPYTILDMSDVYKFEENDNQDIKRGIRLIDSKKRMILQDEIHLSAESDLYWMVHTDAKISIDSSGKKATLTKFVDNVEKKLEIKIISSQEDESVKFSTMKQVPINSELLTLGNNSEGKNKEKLVIHLEKCKDITLSVLFTPIYENDNENYESTEVISLNNWKYLNNTIKGDADCDGTITAYDAYLILKYSTMTTWTKEELDAMDVDLDEKITSYDAYCVLKKSVGY